MTNYEKIISMDIDELAIFLDCIKTRENTFASRTEYKKLGNTKIYDCHFEKIKYWLENKADDKF